MSVIDIRVLRNMEMRFFIFTLLLFQIVPWCSAKFISVIPKVVSADLEEAVQDSIRNLVHTGIYSHRHLDPSQVSVATPVKVTRDGELVSFSVEHAHEHGHARARRDVFGTEHAMEHSLHYNITVDGRELRLDLRPSVSFITPGMIIERHYGESRTRERPRVEATSCHYTGSVRGQPSSRIAISACDGLAGLLRTEHGEFWIEPSNHTSEENSTGRPHVVFKRSAVDKVKAYHRAKREAQTTETKPTHANRSKNQRQTGHHPRKVGRQRNKSAYRYRKNNNRGKIDPKTLQLAEKRRRRLEILRRNPEYRRQQLERRRMKAMSRSSSTSSVSKSRESVEGRRNNSRNRTSQQRRIQRVQNRRRRRRSKNCATVQPPYQWSEKPYEKLNPHTYNYQNYNKTHHPRRYPHHHQLSHRPEFETSRRARSVSIPRHVEVMLVADRSMTDFHRQGDIQTYLLTIMNMVSSLYMDPSIGNFIKIVVVKIVTLEKLQAAPELDVSSNADLTLSSFCHWQQQENPDNDDDPYHHDVAILVTRKDICSQHDVPCSTLGVAHVAGMCKPDRSCSVNEDNGIMLAHTITHELGHNFGLYHDTEKIGCHRREGSTLHIMTPFFEADTVQVAWSKCSKRDVTMFLDSGFGECLGDEPSKKIYEYPEAPAGVTFDAAIQCRLQFGVDAAACSDPSDLCKHLWCYVNNTCKSMLRPPAPGTTCGPDMWCQNQECVPRAPSPAPVDGGWGPWTEWSECSRSCGAGVSTQSRECNNPLPNNNGKYCIGDRSRYKICNTDPCPINEPTFRELQCSKFANMTYNNDTVAEWRPIFDQEKPCELICVPRDSDDEDGLVGGIVADGTRCGLTANHRDTCIAGVCYKVGCDWEVNSDREEDACGVCGGDGTACKTVQGIYNKGLTKQSGLSEVAIIPAGSRNVKIQEKVNPKNYISIGSAKSRRVYFNGYQNTTKTEYFVAGSHAIYERTRDWEKVNIPGPIAEDIKVYQRIIRGHHLNPGVTYQYTVDRKFRYQISEWSPCSVSCGVGYMRRHYECVDKYERVVDLSQCYNMEPPRHEALMQQCRQPSCSTSGQTHWWVGSWSPCSRPCRSHADPYPTKSRQIYCIDKRLNAVTDDSHCDIVTKPATTVLCNVPNC